jgi:hypothetical protein
MPQYMDSPGWLVELVDDCVAMGLRDIDLRAWWQLRRNCFIIWIRPSAQYRVLFVLNARLNRPIQFCRHLPAWRVKPVHSGAYPEQIGNKSNALPAYLVELLSRACTVMLLGSLLTSSRGYRAVFKAEVKLQTGVGTVNYHHH